MCADAHRHITGESTEAESQVRTREDADISFAIGPTKQSVVSPETFEPSFPGTIGDRLRGSRSWTCEDANRRLIGESIGTKSRVRTHKDANISLATIKPVKKTPHKPRKPCRLCKPRRPRKPREDAGPRQMTGRIGKRAQKPDRKPKSPGPTAAVPTGSRGNTSAALVTNTPPTVTPRPPNNSSYA